jgi:hypothetical protein
MAEMAETAAVLAVLDAPVCDRSLGNGANVEQAAGAASR